MFGTADYNSIQATFLFESVPLYGILGTAVARTAGRAVVRRTQPLNRGNVIGGVLFGIGRSIAGRCPGPILVAGEG